jgi:hypothetical protein
MVVFDATMMLLLMRPDIDIPLDPKTQLPVEHAEARISGLVQELEKGNTKIIVPTPALSELLVRAGDSEKDLINTIQKSAVFSIEPFDTLAAIEAAAMTRQAIKNGDKRGGVDCSWTKLKYDRQIMAIAKVHGATAIYSDDGHIHAHCEIAKIKAIRLADLPIPKDLAQGKLFDKRKGNVETGEKPIVPTPESMFEETEDQDDNEPTE